MTEPGLSLVTDDDETLVRLTENNWHAYLDNFATVEKKLKI